MKTIKELKDHIKELESKSWFDCNVDDTIREWKKSRTELETLGNVLKLIDDEKVIVKKVCQGITHPSQENIKEFREWLQGTVIFHLNQLGEKIK